MNIKVLVGSLSVLDGPSITGFCPLLLCASVVFITMLVGCGLEYAGGLVLEFSLSRVGNASGLKGGCLCRFSGCLYLLPHIGLFFFTIPCFVVLWRLWSSSEVYPCFYCVFAMEK